MQVRDGRQEPEVRVSKRLVKCDQGGKPSKTCKWCSALRKHTPCPWEGVKKCLEPHKCDYGRKIICQCVLAFPKAGER